jgi:hypothetical protein
MSFIPLLWAWAHTGSHHNLYLFLSLTFSTYCRCRGLLLHLITITQTHTLGRTPLDEGSARRRDLYLTTHNIHKRQTSMPPAGFEPEIAASERPQTYTIDSAASGIGKPA